MLWKPDVSLLVLLYVGGVCLVCILLRMEGTEEPLFSCKRQTLGSYLLSWISIEPLCPLRDMCRCHRVLIELELLQIS